MHPALRALSVNLADDLPLAGHDLIASAAYARALGQCGVLSRAEARRLRKTLLDLGDAHAAGRWAPDPDAEDIHTAIELEVTRRLGDLGKKLHTGRSRNDQVATALRMAARERCDSLKAQLRGLIAVLAHRAVMEIDTLAPGMTHMQRGQPVRLAHWLLAHTWPLVHDAERFGAIRARVNVLPLGSGALSGHAFRLDREALAAELGFEGVSDNSLDAVGDRDFVIGVVFGCAMTAMHLSRLAEELVVMSTSEFGFVEWPAGLATGSSLMPNKKNPDLVELVRARAGLALGELTGLFAVMKGLPASYQRDLQETKAPLWRATVSLAQSLAAMTAALAGIRFAHDRIAAALTDDLLATEAADALVATGIPFREAHHAVAEAVDEARRCGVGLRELGAHPGRLPPPLTPALLSGLSFARAVERRQSTGGTARAAVRKQLAKLQRWLASSP